MAEKILRIINGPSSADQIKEGASFFIQGRGHFLIINIESITKIEEDGPILLEILGKGRFKKEKNEITFSMLYNPSNRQGHLEPK